MLTFFPPAQSTSVARSEPTAPRIDASLRLFDETIFPFRFDLSVNTSFFKTPDVLGSGTLYAIVAGIRSWIDPISGPEHDNLN